MRKIVTGALILAAVRGAAPEMKLLPAIFGGEADFATWWEMCLGTLAALGAAGDIRILALALPLATQITGVVMLQAGLGPRGPASRRRQG